MTTHKAQFDPTTSGKQNFAAEVVIALNQLNEPGWSVDLDPTWDDYRDVYLDGPSGERLMIGPDWRSNNRRVRIDGLLPNTKGRRVLNCTTPSITVGVYRGAEAVAKAIRSRFLEDYRAELAEQVRQNELKQQRQAERDAQIARLAASLGGNSLDDDQAKRTISSGWRTFGTATFRPSSGGINVELSWIDEELALQVAALVGKYFDEKKTRQS